MGRSVRLPERDQVTDDTPPDRETAMRRAIHDWYQEDTPLACKLTLMPVHVDALMRRLSAALAIVAQEDDR